MAQTTAPVLVAGGLYAFDKAVVQKQGIPWKALLATGIAVAMFAGIEKIDAKVAVRLSYLVLVGEFVTTSVATDFASWVSGGFQTGAGSGAISAKSVSAPVTSTGYIGTTTTHNADGTNTFTNTYNGGTITLTKPPITPAH